MCIKSDKMFQCIVILKFVTNRVTQSGIYLRRRTTFHSFSYFFFIYYECRAHWTAHKINFFFCFIWIRFKMLLHSINIILQYICVVWLECNSFLTWSIYICEWTLYIYQCNQTLLMIGQKKKKLVKIGSLSRYLYRNK